MSWGYWGIVAGLIVLLAVFFICMELLYSDAPTAAKGNGRAAGEGKTAASDAKRAA